MTTISGVYEIRNITNGKRYIGSSVNIPKRLSGHRRLLCLNKHHSRHLQGAWNKHGENCFSFTPVLFCDPENTLLFEQMLIDGLKPEYNIAKNASASMKGFKHTKETVQKMSMSRMGNQHMLGRHLSEETRKKLSESLKGRVFSEDHKKRLSDAQKGVPKSEKNKKSLSESMKSKNRHPSEETRKKLSSALIGNNRAVGNHNTGMLGKHHTEETKQKMSESRKRFSANTRGEL